jgi:hypothetical protein
VATRRALSKDGGTTGSAGKTGSAGSAGTADVNGTAGSAGTAGATGTRGEGGSIFKVPVGMTQCSDDSDGDGDGLIDSADPECTGPADNDESSYATGILLRGPRRAHPHPPRSDVHGQGLWRSDEVLALHTGHPMYEHV